MKGFVRCTLLALVYLLNLPGLSPGQDQGQTVSSKSQPPTGIPSEASERKLGVSVVYSSEYLISLNGLERLHTFDIHKYEKIYQRLIKEELLDDSSAYKPSEATATQLELVHEKQYLNQDLADPVKLIRYLEAPPALARLPINFDRGVLKPFRMTTGGTILAAELALKSGIAINIGGGYHHAKPAIGEGFCVYADIPVAIRCLQQAKRIKRAVVIDVDAHQGNGTIVCCQDDPQVFTFSIHEGGIYPIPKEQGSLDVELETGTGDQEYLRLLKQHLPKVLNRARADICFIVGGCDTLADDPLSNLAMTPSGIKERDQWIVDQCVAKKLPVVFTTSGGYSKDAWKAQFESIANLIRRYGLSPKATK